MTVTKLENKRWSDEEFQDYLTRVRTWYPTGAEVDMDEVWEYRRRMPENRNLVLAQGRAEAEGNILLCPRAGFATIEQTLEVHSYIRDNGGSDLVRVSTDFYTRMGEFDKARAALEESIRAGQSKLNGFPSVVHGVAGNRRLYEGINLPITTTCNTPHSELHYLISLASGAAECLGDAFLATYDIRDARLGEVIIHRQFVDRLIAWYESKGFQIFKANKFVGVLTPPSLKIASTVLGMLLAAEQGVKHFSLQANPNLSVVQDVAFQRVLHKLAREYLKRAGYDGRIMFGLSMYNGPHPDDHGRCFAFILLGAALARWGGASRLESRTVDEGRGVPTKENQAITLRAIREMLDLLRDQPFSEGEDFRTECRMIEREARAVIEKVFELGDGDVAVGAVKALELGVLDFPYPNNKYLKGNVITVRDSNAAVRFLDYGNLPFGEDIKQFHRERVAARQQSEKKSDTELIVEGLTGKVVSGLVRHVGGSRPSVQVSRPQKRPAARPVVVAGSLNDIHSVGLRVLGYTLENDFQLVRLGSMVSQEEFINAAVETNARAILVSSLYGHAPVDCLGLRQKCVEAGLKDIRLYLGGNVMLGADRPNWPEVEASFKKMGFDRVYPPGVSSEQVLADLTHDLAHQLPE